jgi:alpha,alpha-trehalase
MGIQFLNLSEDRAHTILADFYTSSLAMDSASASRHSSAADSIRAGILDLFWDPTKLAFYDFNLTSNLRNTIYSAATFYPLWSGIIPDELLGSSDKAFGFFSGLNLVLNRYNGTLPTTFLTSGLQWFD